MTITIPGNPITKKNSQRIFINKTTGKPFIKPSAQYEAYAEAAGWFIPRAEIDYPVNVQCVYYLNADRIVDLCNLLECTCDVLEKYGCVKNDCSRIIVSHDGSRVKVDRKNPRTEITITRV